MDNTISIKEANLIYTIDSFRYEYGFLSNMHDCRVEYNNEVFNNSESAYQANKTLDKFERALFYNKTGKEAKRLGKRVALREDFDEIKIKLMYEVCKAKFSQNTHLKQKLVETYPNELIEGNWWGDTFWGMCNGKGSNFLGRILMIIRDELMVEDSEENTSIK